MTGPSNEQDSLEEFREIVGFLRSLWAVLAGVSVFFPLSNALAQLVPLATWPDKGGLVFLSPLLVSTLSTVGCLFAILWTLVQRGQYARQKKQSVRRLAGLSLAFGALALVLYLAANFAIVGDIHEDFGVDSSHPIRILGDILLLFTYTCFFAFTTRAFMLLGLLEYFRKGKRAV
jgi:hypothetical protein